MAAGNNDEQVAELTERIEKLESSMDEINRGLVVLQQLLSTGIKVLDPKPPS
jgi:uncharacterized protein Yka (UPF0111/DUF47 family)